MIKVAINGFGRIGRPTFKALLEKEGDSKIDIVAINDLTDTKTLAHLLKYDSVYGIYKKQVKSTEDGLLINGSSKDKRIKVFAEQDPRKLPWKKLGIDIVLECTGRFTDYDNAKKHLDAGAKKVIISAPCNTPEKIPSFILGVNADDFDPKKHHIIDMASCTTNCLAPVAKVLNDNFKIVKGFMITIHSYTTSQRILDLPHKDLRRARAAALNIIPTTTGATKAIERVMPELEGKLDGLAYRVPTPTVSILDLICEVEKETSAQEVNYVFKKASQKKELEGILGVEDALLVSSDYKGNSFSAIVDAPLTRVTKNLVKVSAWYDNEHGYAARLADFAEFMANKL
ncbi:MAG: type I glyceraldehyde-3-phosphate dehydrogenase [Patescibacteria group bacterium]|nr:type I glyceraldehyde-3-phosphate dehydrogenase [Patescibacteria group bacterium]